MLPALLVLLLVSAGIEDARTREIANWKNAAIALMAPLWWVSIGLAPWPDMAIQIGIAAGVLALFCVAFHFGQMGGYNMLVYAGDTVEECLDCIPDLDSRMSAGCLQLIREGAVLVRNADDVVEALGELFARPVRARADAKAEREDGRGLCQQGTGRGHLLRRDGRLQYARLRGRYRGGMSRLHPRP